MRKNPFAIALAFISALLWGMAFWQRGRFDMGGYHSIYEPALLNAMVIIDLPAGLLTTAFLGLLHTAGLPVDMQDGGPLLLVLWILSSSLQWGLISYGIDRYLARRRKTAAENLP